MSVPVFVVARPFSLSALLRSYYLNDDTGERAYPDGGPRAILEEMDIDEEVLSDGVILGPQFKVRLVLLEYCPPSAFGPHVSLHSAVPQQVVYDRDKDFVDTWGHSWKWNTNTSGASMD